MALGSILTSSAKGSCNLLAIDIAPLKETFISGYSSVASLDAEYTDAMTMSGTKVEGYEKLDADLENIVVGEIITIDNDVVFEIEDYKLNVITS